MKRFTCALVICAVGLSTQVQADTVLGVHAGADFWYNTTRGGFANGEPEPTFDFKNKTTPAYYLAFEHFVPLLPNVRVQFSALNTSGNLSLNEDLNYAGIGFNQGSEITSAIQLRSTEYILYYEVLDNPLLSFDLGISAKQLRGDFSVEQSDQLAVERVNHWVPMLYAHAEISLLATGLELFVSGSFSALKDDRIVDAQAGIAYSLLDNLALDAKLKLGYRAMDLRLVEVDNLATDLSAKGVFAGIAIHF